MRYLLSFIFLLVFPTLCFSEPSSGDTTESSDAFTFIRIQYDNYGHGGDEMGWGGGGGGWGGRGGGGGWRFRGTWAVDYPDADFNFLKGVTRLTNIDINADPAVLRLDDDRIFEYPFLYMLEMGRGGGPNFSEKEIKNLREYLLRGGFVFIDDFWGTWEWDNFYSAFARVFPDRPMVELDRDHPIFHTFYDINGPQMIPGIRGFYYNHAEQDAEAARNRAILDNDGRVMVLINWNSDIGDGWEHTYDPEYPTKYANLAYQLGINYLVYAMTH